VAQTKGYEVQAYISTPWQNLQGRRTRLTDREGTFGDVRSRDIYTSARKTLAKSQGERFLVELVLERRHRTPCGAIGGDK